LHQPVIKGEKLAHKVTQPWIGPFVVLQANPEFKIYKLMDVKTQKVLKSWINIARLRPYETDRDALYMRIRQSDADDREQADDQVSGQQTMLPADEECPPEREVNLPRRDEENRGEMTGEPWVALNGKTTKKQQPMDQGAQAVEAEQQCEKRERYFLRSRPTSAVGSERLGAPPTATDGCLAAEARSSTPTPFKKNYQQQPVPGEREHELRSADSTLQEGSRNFLNQRVTRCNTQPTGHELGNQWFEIKEVTAHKRRGNIMYYRVTWSDNTRQWIPRHDISDLPVHLYHVRRQERFQRRKRKK